MQQLRKVQLALALLLAITVSGTADASSLRSRLYGKDAVVLGTIEAEMVDLYASRQTPSLSAPSSMESSSGSSSGMDSDPSPPPQQSVSRSVQGSQVQVHKQSYQQLRNKRGGKMYVISNRNSLLHEGLLDPKRDPAVQQEQTNKAMNEERYKASKDEVEDVVAEQNLKNLRRDEDKEKTAAEEKRKKGEQRTLSLNYILRKDLGVIQPKKGNVIVANEHIQDSLRFTYMFWIKPTGKVPFWGNVLHKGDASNERSPAVYLYPDSTRLHIRSATPNSGNDGAQPDPETPLPMEAWTHVAFAHSEGLFAIFINGKQVSKQTNIGRPKLNRGSLYASLDAPALVDLADIRYYPRIATNEEIADVVDQARYRQ